PHDVAQYLMDIVRGIDSFHGKKAAHINFYFKERFFKVRVVIIDGIKAQSGQVLTHNLGDDEVAVSEALHQRGSTQTVRTVIREITFTEGIQTRDGGHQVVIHP